jgi:hypothetical protein
MIHQLTQKPARLLMSLLALTVLSTGASWAQDFPKPTPEHVWLQQFVGEWESETEAMMEPGKPPVKAKGTETIRPLGGFWTISEVKSTMMDMPFSGNLTLGYDTDKKKYVGTWVDSMTGHLWEYEGNLDATGKTLTLESEGVCPMRPGKMSKFKETIQVVNDDHKVFSSAIQGEDGKWVTMMTSHSLRKK